MSVKVDDEHDVWWVVDKGDKGWNSVSMLRAMGFQSMVLPRARLMGLGEGEYIEEPVTPTQLRYNMCLAGLGVEDTRNARTRQPE